MLGVQATGELSGTAAPVIYQGEALLLKIVRACSKVSEEAPGWVRKGESVMPSCEVDGLSTRLLVFSFRGRGGGQE